MTIGASRIGAARIGAAHIEVLTLEQFVLEKLTLDHIRLDHSDFSQWPSWVALGSLSHFGVHVWDNFRNALA